MGRKPGVYTITKKDGTISYRSSITYNNKHISLGSYASEDLAHLAYKEASAITEGNFTIEDALYSRKFKALPFEKQVVLLNFRDCRIYFKTPIYLRQNYFVYYLDKKTPLKFAIDDLFYYSTHKIMRRGGHLFVSDFGMQVNILSRYGIHNFSVPERDYIFINGDSLDFRYENIEVINKYHGVMKSTHKGVPVYLVKIHVNGDFIVGRYPTEDLAAVAYNKAADKLKEKGIEKEFLYNYIYSMDSKEYAQAYASVKISKKIRNYEL
ncbi:MAG: hypothetical protein K6G65_09155 [Lachnospiraceae bacterium]|nr:hypothetical protein [Lachnospiraceae bacterium]